VALTGGNIVVHYIMKSAQATVTLPFPRVAAVAKYCNGSRYSGMPDPSNGGIQIKLSSPCKPKLQSGPEE